MARVTGTLIALLVLLAGMVLLQIFLSRRESRWPGMVLPGVCFLVSLAAVLSVAAVLLGDWLLSAADPRIRLAGGTEK